MSEKKFKFLVRSSMRIFGKPCEEAHSASLNCPVPEHEDSPVVIPDAVWKLVPSRSMSKTAVEDSHSDEAWYVEFTSLDGFLRFVDKYGRVIISPNSCTEFPYEIEIYDSWRE